jgi:hypothetical protein
MAPPLKPGDGLLFMKVGTHAQESLEAIIARKSKEIGDAGFALWGYGGNTCHPTAMVQPFVRDYEIRGGIVFLCMHPMESKHWAEPLRARQLSKDGVKWEDIPSPINVKGSRYALVIKDLRAEEFDLSLAKTRVAIGNNMGRSGSRYVAGRVDKACLEVTEVAGRDADKDAPSIRIGLVAQIIAPYAVFVRD